jgi:hypothetical protein
MDNMTFKQTHDFVAELLNCNAIPQYFEYSDMVNIIKALEKQTPVKPRFKPSDFAAHGEYYCPTCNKFLGFHYNKHDTYCPDCGQALDWEE